MLELDDSVLLKEYVEHGSEEAFATLVARHVNKVYSIALRHTRNAHQAEEITQAVFVILARKSRQLGKRVILSGWLCRTARLSAVTFVRSEIRRSRREQEAQMQNLLNESESEVWPQIAPLLDAAMAGLSQADQDAVALRFFDGKSMKEIGAALGASEDAGQSRGGKTAELLHQARDRLFRGGFDGGDFGQCGSGCTHWIGRFGFNCRRSFRNNDRHHRNCHRYESHRHG